MILMVAYDVNIPDFCVPYRLKNDMQQGEEKFDLTGGPLKMG